MNSKLSLRGTKVLLSATLGLAVAFMASAAWDRGDPVVTYWAGPGYPGHPEKLTERAAKQLKEGGYNVAWASSVQELDVAAKYGLRCIFDLGLGTLCVTNEAAAAAAAKRIAAVKDHPALYIYHHTDEPSAAKFVDLARTKEYLGKLDPKHPVWINLLPTYAQNWQLGVEGEIISAYWEHVRLFREIYRPDFMTFDHYQFNVGGDTGNYLLNLGIIRQNASAQGVPFFNGVQACTWTPGELASPKAPRIPGPDELRYLVHTTAAYGAHGIYYLVYSFPKHGGSIANMDGTPGPNYEPLKRMNRDFVALARELKPYRFVGAYLQGLHAPGTTPWCEQAVLEIAPKTPTAELQPNQELKDTTLVSRFDDANGPARFMVVNLDYRKDRRIDVEGPSPLDRFDPVSGAWVPLGGKSAALDVIRGSGVLLRVGR